MKVSDLTGAELDYWVAKAEGRNPQYRQLPFAHQEQDMKACYAEFEGQLSLGLYTPSTNWSQGGPLIEKYSITIVFSTV